MIRALFVLFFSLCLVHTTFAQESSTEKSIYKKKWTIIDSLINEGLFNKALDLTDELIQGASDEKNHNQVIKGTIHKLKLQGYVKEDDYILGIEQISALIRTAPSPSKEILHSLLAEIYWAYYSTNSWQINGRTEVLDVDLADIRTWDLKRIAKATKAHYLLSLENKEVSQQTPIESLSLIVLNSQESKNLRPTVYDFLGHRALDFFANNTFNVAGPAETFTIDNPAYFANNTRFLQLNETTNDSLNTRFIALQIFHQLTRFHLKAQNETPLFYIEFERLKYVYDKSTQANKEDLYYAALTRLGTIKKEVEEASELWYEIAKIHYQRGVKYDHLGDTTLRYEIQKAWAICKKVIAELPKNIGTGQCQSLLAQIEQKSMSFKTETVVPTETPDKLLLNYKNIDQLYYKIVAFDYDREVQHRYENKDSMLARINRSNILFSKTVQVNDPGDFQNHSTELEIPGLKSGYYYIVLSSSEDFTYASNAVSYEPLWVTDLTYQYRNTGSYGEILVTDRKSGEPIQGAEVRAYEREYNYQKRESEFKKYGEYKSDKEGKVKVTMSLRFPNLYYQIEYKEDFYDPNTSQYFYKERGDKANVSTHLYTDRKLYRPGQDIYFKGIMVEYKGDERKLVTNKSNTVTFYDANGQEIDKLSVKTNSFGSFEGKFKAPYGAMTGLMRIQDKEGSTYIHVEEYKRPKFEVKMLPFEGEYQVNDSVETKGEAIAFAGNKIDGATVTYRVMRQVNYPWGRWWGWFPQVQPKEIAHGETITDENGQFVLRFKAIPNKESDPKKLPVFTYTVYADVVDLNGETHASSTALNLGYHTLQLGNNFHEDINVNGRFTPQITATNLNGNSIDVKGQVSISKLKTPRATTVKRYWKQPDLPIETAEKFQKDVYQNEDNYASWAQDKVAYTGDFNTGTSDTLSLSDIANWQPGIYKYEAKAKDKNGLEIVDIRYFSVFNPKGKIIPDNSVLWAKALQTTAQPGDVVELLVGTHEKELYVFYDVESKDGIESSKIIRLNREQKKLKLLITEEHRGNVTVHLSAVKNNRHYAKDITINVPYANKQLDLSFSSFRDKLLPGQKEEWTLHIQNKNGEGETAELLASLYDASLDALATPNSFYTAIYGNYSARKGWNYPVGMSTGSSINYELGWNRQVAFPTRRFASLNYFGWSPSYYGRIRYRSYQFLDQESIGGVEEMELYDISIDGNAASFGDRVDKSFGWAGRAKAEANEGTYALSIADEKNNTEPNAPAEQIQEEDFTAVKARENFNETAFFMPQITTNEKGDVQLKFTMPESLTKWKFLGLAHTEDLKMGYITEEVVTQKDLMVMPNMPRFLREGDQLTLSAKIVNISSEHLSGQAVLQLIDPFTEEVISTAFSLTEDRKNFDVEKEKSTAVSWTIAVPENYGAVAVKILAKSGNFSDGEEHVLPILSNRMLVTESLPLPIRGEESKTFTFEKLTKSNLSTSLKHHNFTLEFTSNPAWYAVQAMPYMMEYPHECAEQTFTRYYSNTIASHIMNSSPRVKEIIEEWGANSPDAFLSNLQKNQELKAVMLEETPWVLAAKSEEASKRNLSVLLDMNRMSRELDKAFSKLSKMQSSNGAWPWFKGMAENRFITQHIVTGFGHLDHLGIKSIRSTPKEWKMVKDAVQYLDEAIVRDFEYIKKYNKDYLTEQHIGYTHIQYLYARSYFNDLFMPAATKEAVAYFKNQATTYWLEFNLYAEGMIALAANRMEMSDLAVKIVKSLKDRAINDEEMGMYWKDSYLGYQWYQAPIETHALMIELFDEVGNDQNVVDELKIWLLKQKQTTNWKTTKQTTEAVYALLLKGSDLLSSEEMVSITVGGKAIKYLTEPNEEDPYQVKTEAGTGYFKTSWPAEAVKAEMGNITVKKASKGVAWGAAYWQYFEDLDKITFAETNLKLKKQVYRIKISNAGEQLVLVSDQDQLQIGDKVRVRIELRTDRNLEYVHMKDMRAAGFEPVDVLSRYRYQDGLGYYQSTKDAATHFFFDYIQKGTYVFEYDLKVEHAGDFANGITSIQCMYAPEFTSHSEGIRVKVN
jgi:hypothetical protein